MCRTLQRLFAFLAGFAAALGTGLYCETWLPPASSAAGLLSTAACCVVLDLLWPEGR